MTVQEVQDIDLGRVIVDEPIEDGVYRAVLYEVKAIDNKFEPGKQQLQLKWELLEGDAKGKQLTSWANLVRLTPKAKIRQIAEALYGRALPDDQSITTGALVGREANIVVKQIYTADNATLVSKVTDYLPVRAAKPTIVGDNIPF